MPLVLFHFISGYSNHYLKLTSNWWSSLRTSIYPFIKLPDSCPVLRKCPDVLWFRYHSKSLECPWVERTGKWHTPVILSLQIVIVLEGYFICFCWNLVDLQWGTATDPHTRASQVARTCRRHERLGFDPWVWKSPWRRKWQPTPGFLPGKCYAWRSLAGNSPQGLKESDTTEWLCVCVCVYCI